MLKDAIKHNKYVLDKLNSLLETSVKYYKDLYAESIQHETIKRDIIKGIVRDIDYYDDGEMISYHTVHAKDGIITNLIKVTATSEDAYTNRLIQEVNEIYYKIQNIIVF